jgi:hypothetical protein
VKLLVWYGANILNPEGGKTLLQYTYAQKLPHSVKNPVIRNLVEYGIDVFHKDENGKTIYDDAIDNRDWTFLKFMVTNNFPSDVEALKKLRNLPAGSLFNYLEGCADELLMLRRQHDAHQLLVNFSRGCVQLNLQDGIRILTRELVCGFDVRASGNCHEEMVCGRPYVQLCMQLCMQPCACSVQYLQHRHVQDIRSGYSVDYNGVQMQTSIAAQRNQRSLWQFI